MMAMYALESRGRGFVLAFAGVAVRWRLSVPRLAFRIRNGDLT
jgi:hypothetical protein